MPGPAGRLLDTLVMAGSEADEPGRPGSGAPSPYHELGRPGAGEAGAGAPPPGSGDASPAGSFRESWAPVGASLSGSLHGPDGWRWVVTVIRIAVAKAALDYMGRQHHLIQVFLVLTGLGCLIWWHRWIGVALLVVALLVFLLYMLVTKVIERLSMPKRVRKSLDGAKDEIRSELERLHLPTGPVSGVRFAWRLARGKHPRSETIGRMQEGARRIGPIVSRALADAGVRPSDAEPGPVAGPQPPV